ncbi:MAG: LptF/LptG family permease [Planctomycetes bacterium]|nr:LptF/LptG family permease [Planctomycetota bacterium]
MPWTLQRYICREMGKTFLLTAAVLTAVFGLGGGVMNMVELKEATPGQLLRLLTLILPVSAALTLPMAALFSAAATYGRLSADNEFVACRASGINIHVLFLPTLLLSLLAAGVTFAFTNSLIPGMVRNLNELVRADVGAIIQQRLNRPRGITLGNQYRIHADESVVDRARPDHVVLNRVAFLEVSGDDWVRFGTAREIHLDFERGGTNVRLYGRMAGLSFYDSQKGQFADLEEQLIPPNELPALVPPEIKFLRFGELLHLWDNPDEWVYVRGRLERLRAGVGRVQLYDDLLADLRQGRPATLSDDRARYTLRTPDARRMPRGAGLELMQVSIDEDRQGRKRSLKADRAVLEVTRGESLAECGVTLDAFNVRSAAPGDRTERAKERLGPVAVEADRVAAVQRLSTADLLAPRATPEGEEVLQELRADALKERSTTVRRVVATLHERCAFSVSVFVLVLLGAALGAILRGAHVLAAFGISFVPALLVIVTIVTGKQLSQNASTYALGLAVLWSGMLLVAVLDGWVMSRVLRR